MTLGAAIIFSPFLFEDHDRAGSALPEDLRGHAGLLDPWTADQQAAARILHQPDLRQLDGSPLLTGELLELEDRSRLDTILLATAFDDRVHGCPHWETQLFIT